jgi:peroxiredoxin
MKKKINWSLHASLACCSLVIFFFVNAAAQAEQDSNTNAESYKASDFTLKDLRGQNVKLSTYKGKPILLNFMTTWCPDCRASIPHLKDIYSRYNSQGLIMLNVSVMETKEKVEAYSKKYELPYPTLLDEDGKISKEYGVVGVPVRALINREGQIICWNCRRLDQYLEMQFTDKK